MSEKINDGGPAFPVVAENGLGHIAGGMTLRDWFAGQALAAWPFTWPPGMTPAERSADAAARAYVIADAMLAERGKAQP
jgi:hypothetical protein